MKKVSFFHLQLDVLDLSNPNDKEEHSSGENEHSTQFVDSVPSKSLDPGVSSRNFYGAQPSKVPVKSHFARRSQIKLAAGKKSLKCSKRGKRNQSKVSKAKSDGDAKWEDIEGLYNNPNNDIPFSESVGVSREAAAAKTVLEHFLLFFRLSIIDKIVKHTNLFYYQTSLKQSVPSGFKTCREEIMAFFGIIIAMGIAKLPEINDYWRTGILRMPWFGSIMSRNHFKVILRFLHLADNSKQLPRNDIGHDKLFKLGNLPKILSQRFSELYSRKCSLSIDEQMIGTKARISFLQYMAKKPKDLESNFGPSVSPLQATVSNSKFTLVNLMAILNMA